MKIPAAFRSLARGVNLLARKVRHIEGRNGIKVTHSAGRILLQLDNINYDGTGADVSTGGTAFTTFAQAVTDTGPLANVPAYSANGNTYPTAGKYVTASGNVDISATGVVITSSGGNICNLAFASITHDLTLQTFVGISNGNAANYLTLASGFF